MTIPLRITFHKMEQSEAIESEIRRRAEKLERFSDHIMDCRVSVEPSSQHHNKGNLYRIVVDIDVPTSEIVASRNPDKNHAHEDVNVAIRDAFDSAKRQLEDFERRVRGDVKRHSLPETPQFAE
jgi:ribosomal subunit interface protein